MNIHRSKRPADPPSPRVGTVSRVVPSNHHTQGEILDALEHFWADQHYNSDRLQRLFRNVEVSARNLALPLSAYAELTDFGARNDAFIEQATRLGAEAVDAALRAAGLDVSDVDALFFTTITGVATPSVDVHVANALGMRRDLKRTPLFGLGCVGGAAGLARMADYLRAFPQHVAVLLSVELCSLTLQPEDLSVKNLIASGLFGDGAAAVVGIGGEHPAYDSASGPSIVATKSVLYPDTEWVMGWNVGSDGLGLVLSAELPSLIRRELRVDVDGFLDEHGLSRDAIDIWVMHPGGPAVLEALQDAMEVPREAFARTWSSLQSVGNISSASVLFVLGDEIDAGAANAGDTGLLVAMGPGFCAEQLLLRW